LKEGKEELTEGSPTHASPQAPSNSQVEAHEFLRTFAFSTSTTSSAQGIHAFLLEVSSGFARMGIPMILAF